MFVGVNDELASYKDSVWLHEELQNGYGNNPKPVVYYKEYDAGHYTFIVGKDMSYMDDVVELLAKYNIVSDSDKDSEKKFYGRNDFFEK